MGAGFVQGLTTEIYGVAESGGTALAATATWPVPTTNGNLLVCACYASSGQGSTVPPIPAPPVISPPSTPGVTWVLAATASNNGYERSKGYGTSVSVAIYYAANAASNSATTTVDATEATSVNFFSVRFELYEINGTNGILDASAGGYGTYPTVAYTANLATTETDLVLVLGFDGDETGNTYSAGPGYTALPCIVRNEQYILGAAPGSIATAFANSNTVVAPWACAAVAFQAQPPVTVISVSPSSGPIAGGTAVTITGTNFLSGATVAFGGAAATSVVVVSSTQITCVTPAHAAGPVNVSVTDSDGTGTLVNGYLYVVPTVTNVMPSSGPIAGGTPVTISGTYFLAGASVDFGGAAGTSVVVVSSTQITCVTPPHALGSVTVSVTDADGTGSLPNGFTYTSGGGGGGGGTGGSEYMFVWFPDGVTENDFTPVFPPTKKQPEEDWGMEAVRHDSLTSSGLKQSVLERFDTVSQVDFPYVAQSDMAAWKAFEAYALAGGIFFYRPNIGWPDDTGFLTCSMLSMDWTPKHKSFQIFSLDMKLRLEAPEAGS